MRSPTLYCILLASVCLACRHATKQPSAAPDSAVSTHSFSYPQAGPIVLGYNRFLSQLDTGNLTNSQVAWQRFQKDFTGQSAQVCDTGFMLFWALQQRLNCNTPEKYIGPANLDSLADAEFNGKRLSPRQQKIYQILQDNHFIVAEDEGNSFLTPGWRLMNAHFSHYLSDPMKEALAQNAKEEMEGFQDDAAFTISPRQLASRTVWWENFMTKYPHHIYLEDAKPHYDMLMYLLVKGMDNAHVVEDDSLITPFYDTVYMHLRDSFPNSRTNAVIAPYRLAWLVRDTTTIKRVQDSLGHFVPWP